MTFNTTLHHAFDVDLATLYGLEESIMIHHFQYWIRHAKSLGKNQHEGRTWWYQSIREISAHFDYWSIKQVEKILNKLVDKKIIIKGNFNKNPFERKCWYAFENEKMFAISPFGEMQIRKRGNDISLNGEMLLDKDKNNKRDNETTTIPPPTHEPPMYDENGGGGFSYRKKKEEELIFLPMKEIMKHFPDASIDLLEKAIKEARHTNKPISDPIKYLKVIYLRLNDTAKKSKTKHIASTVSEEEIQILHENRSFLEMIKNKLSIDILEKRKVKILGDVIEIKKGYIPIYIKEFKRLIMNEIPELKEICR